MRTHFKRGQASAGFAKFFVALAFSNCLCGGAFATPVTADTTVTLSSDSSESYEISSGVTLTIEVASEDTAVLSGAITGAGTLRKAGLGTLALSNGNNVIPGGIDIAEGTVRADAAGALGDGELRIVQGGTARTLTSSSRHGRRRPAARCGSGRIPTRYSSGSARTSRR